MRSFAVLIASVLLVAAACSSDDGGSDALDASSEAAMNAACSLLDQSACERFDECEPYHAWPKAVACVSAEPSEPLSYMGCGSAFRSCTLAWTWAAPVDHPDDLYQFIDGCLPEGWVGAGIDNSVCSACQGLTQANCEATAGCAPLFGAPVDANCQPGEQAYAGCMTGDLPCSAVPIWAHSVEAPDEWWTFPEACRPDGWVEVYEPPCE